MVCRPQRYAVGAEGEDGWSALRGSVMQEKRGSEEKKNTIEQMEGSQGRKKIIAS